MKKYFVLIFMLLVGACANSVNKKEFVNPVFNQPLRPLSNGDGYVYLTPTSIDMRTPKDKNLVAGKGECELVENTQERITLKCAVKWVEPSTYEDAQRLLNKKQSWSQELGRDILKRLSPDYYEDWYFAYSIYESKYLSKYTDITEECWLAGESEYKSRHHYIINQKSYSSESD